MRSKRIRAISFAAIALVAIVTSALAWPVADRWLRAGQLLTRLAAAEESTQSAHLVEQEVWLRAHARPIRARIYRRADTVARRGVVVAHGVHYRGIEERRLVPFARELARSGLVVLTPELDDLIDYRISQRGVQVIKQSIRYLGERADLELHDGVGLLGFSFAGGLSLVAAADPELAERVAFVTSIGGHHDLARVLEFLVSGVVATPGGKEERKPHEYGLVILTYQHLEHFVPEPDLGLMRQALRAWLMEDRPRARQLAAGCSTPAALHLFTLLESERLAELAGELRAIVTAHRPELDALSPHGRLGRIHAPVYLVHGVGDSVIPPSEARWAARELEQAHSPHIALVTPLIEHVAVDRAADITDRLALVRVMAQLM